MYGASFDLGLSLVQEELRGLGPIRTSAARLDGKGVGRVDKPRSIMRKPGSRRGWTLAIGARTPKDFLGIVR